MRSSNSGEERGLDIEFSHAANNLIIIKPQAKLWKLRFSGGQVGEHLDVLGGDMPRFLE